MIIEELYKENLIRHYSDSDVKIRQVETDYVYDEAIDVIPCRYTYEETDIPIVEPEPEPEPDEQTLQEIIAELQQKIAEQEEEISDLDDYIIELVYDSIIDDLDLYDEDF